MTATRSVSRTTEPQPPTFGTGPDPRRIVWRYFVQPALLVLSYEFRVELVQFLANLPHMTGTPYPLLWIGSAVAVVFTLNRVANLC